MESMEEKYSVLIPKTYKYLVFDFYYKTEHVDYKKAVVDREATEEVKKFINNCDCDYRCYTREQLENLFMQGFVLVRISSEESILTYREHIRRGFNLMFMKSKDYQSLRKQCMKVVKNG